MVIRIATKVTYRRRARRVDASTILILKRDGFRMDRHRALALRLGMISAQTLRVCREGRPLHTFPDHALLLLCHKFCLPRALPQQGHRGKVLAMALASRMRMVAIEFGM
jgi:hypothetical protein